MGDCSGRLRYTCRQSSSLSIPTRSRPRRNGNFYELYAIAAAVVGGCTGIAGRRHPWPDRDWRCPAAGAAQPGEPADLGRVRLAVMGAVILAGTIADQGSSRGEETLAGRTAVRRAFTAREPAVLGKLPPKPTFVGCNIVRRSVPLRNTSVCDPRRSQAFTPPSRELSRACVQVERHLLPGNAPRQPHGSRHLVALDGQPVPCRSGYPPT